MRTIRASEVGNYLYCQRAWWYQKNGEQPDNLADMAIGNDLHHKHGRAMLEVGCLRFMAYTLMLLALVLLAIYFSNHLI